MPDFTQTEHNDNTIHAFIAYHLHTIPGLRTPHMLVSKHGLSSAYHSPFAHTVCREALTQALGASLDLTAVQPVIEAMQAVRIWANQLTGGQAPVGAAASGSSSSAAARSSTAAIGGASSSSSGSANTGSRTVTSTSGSRDAVSTTPQAWGSSIPWTIPAFVGGSSSDDHGNASAPGAETANGSTETAPWPLGPLILPETALKRGAAAAGGLQFQGLGPSPEDVRQMALGSSRGAQPGKAAEDEEYLGEEYQEGKGVKEVNAVAFQEIVTKTLPCPPLN
jgi:hypothetical protein